MFGFGHCIHGVGHSTLLGAMDAMGEAAYDACTPPTAAKLEVSAGALARALQGCAAAPARGIAHFCAIGAFMSYFDLASPASFGEGGAVADRRWAAPCTDVSDFAGACFVRLFGTPIFGERLREFDEPRRRGAVERAAEAVQEAGAEEVEVEAEATEEEATEEEATEEEATEATEKEATEEEATEKEATEKEAMEEAEGPREEAEQRGDGAPSVWAQLMARCLTLQGVSHEPAAAAAAAADNEAVRNGRKKEEETVRGCIFGAALIGAASQDSSSSTVSTVDSAGCASLLPLHLGRTAVTFGEDSASLLPSHVGGGDSQQPSHPSQRRRRRLRSTQQDASQATAAGTARQEWPRALACVAGSALSMGTVVAARSIPHASVRRYCEQLGAELAAAARAAGLAEVMEEGRRTEDALAAQATRTCWSSAWLCDSSEVTASCGLFDAAAAVLDVS